MSLEFDIEPAAAQPLIGDQLRLGQVLINYMTNAIKFTERGGVVVKISVLEDQAEDCRIRVEVRDTGIGMTPQIVQSLFQVFQQGDNSTTRRFGGSGLGLAICKRLAELFGGEVGVDSTPGVGSNFWFTGRFKKAAAGDTPALGPRDQADQDEAVRRLAGCRILGAEDDEVNQLVATLLLERVGIEVRLADDGHEAIRLLGTERFDGGAGHADAQHRRVEVAHGAAPTPRKHRPLIAMTANARKRTGRVVWRRE